MLILLYRVNIILEPVNENLTCDHRNESYALLIKLSQILCIELCLVT